jgi:cysteine desulfurase / selenocysteine lyase
MTSRSNGPQGQGDVVSRPDGRPRSTQHALFWETTLRPLFSENALEYQVSLLDGSKTRYLNFDHAATTMPFLDVQRHVEACFDIYGSVHRGTGQKSALTTAMYDATRDRIRRYVGAGPEDYVLFSKNTTEAINHAATLWSTVPGRVLVSDIEHSSNLLPWVRHGSVVQYRTRPDGTVELDEIEAVLRRHSTLAASERIKLVTFTTCSNITGYCPPIYQIAELAHRYGAVILADMCQHIPHEKVDMRPASDPAHLDFCAFSGHKMYAPYGVGVLVGPKQFFDAQPPYHVGGGNLPYITRDLVMKRYLTERAHDPGTPNAMGPIALAKAMDVLDDVGRDRISDYEHDVVHHAYQRLAGVPGLRMYVRSKLLGHVIPFDLEGFDSRLVATVLAHEHGIGVRAGAFCTYEYIRKLKGISDEEDQRIAAEVDRGVIRNIPHVTRASFSICNPHSDGESLATALEVMTERQAGFYHARYVQDETIGTWTLRG